MVKRRHENMLGWKSPYKDTGLNAHKIMTLHPPIVKPSYNLPNRKELRRLFNAKRHAIRCSNTSYMRLAPVGQALCALHHGQ